MLQLVNSTHGIDKVSFYDPEAMQGCTTVLYSKINDGARSLKVTFQNDFYVLTFIVGKRTKQTESLNMVCANIFCRFL